MPPFAFDQARINKLTVEQVAGIVFNENRDVVPGESTAEELQAAKTAQAHAVINGDRKLGIRRPATATWKVPDRLKKSAQYEQALTAARTAFQDDNVGIDSTGSRIHFNNRYDDADLDAPWVLDNGQFQPFHHYGPFKLGKRAVWTLIYDDSK